MDPWASPWGDDAGRTPDRLDSATSASLSLANASAEALSAPLDPADPWSVSYLHAQTDTADSEKPQIDSLTVPSHAVASNSRSAEFESTWGNGSDSFTVTSIPPRRSSVDAATSHAEAELELPSLSNSQDPWAVENAAWSSPSQDDAVEEGSLTLTEAALSGTNQFVDTRRDEWTAQNAGWSDAPSINTPANGLEARNPVSDSVPSEAYLASKTADDARADIWTVEASHRAQRARQLDRDEIDRLKLEARQLIGKVHSQDSFQAAFISSSSGEGDWSILFGSEGDKRELLHWFQSPPHAFRASDGTLQLHMMSDAPITRRQSREALSRTEHRGVRLAAPDSGSAWQRQGRVHIKPEWIPHGQSESASRGSIDGRRGVFESDAVSGPREASGPGWFQTSSSDTRSASGSSFIANLFKGRQTASAASTARSDTAQSSDPPSARTSQDMAVSRRSASPSATVLQATVPVLDGFGASIPSYRDNANNKYSDDPTGPDLLNLEQNVETSVQHSAPSHARKQSWQAPSLLNRWKPGSLFGRSTNRSHPNWASAGMGSDDLGWLDEQEKSPELNDSTHYDEDDSFDDYQGSSAGTSLFGRKSQPPGSALATSVSHGTEQGGHPDPYESLFGDVPAQRSSRRSADFGQSNKNQRVPAISMPKPADVVSTALTPRSAMPAPLPPPPTFSRPNRVSLPPPPRSAKDAGALSSHGNDPSAEDPFASFFSGLEDQLPTSAQGQQRLPNPANNVQMNKGESTDKPDSGSLTADDLLFFDSL